MPQRSHDFLLAAHGIAPLPITPGRFGRWVRQVLADHAAAEVRNRDIERLRAMPDYLLRDIGLTREDVRWRKSASVQGRLLG
jgi:uncharacterized protein YjiS (DUF1127 family)